MMPWDETGLWLFTPDEIAELPNGIILESITGHFAVKGKDDVDRVTRGGYTAYGIRNPFRHDLKETFIEWRLKSGY